MIATENQLSEHRKQEILNFAEEIQTHKNAEWYQYIFINTISLANAISKGDITAAHEYALINATLAFRFYFSAEFYMLLRRTMEQLKIATEQEIYFLFGFHY